MPPARRPEFEPSFGARATDALPERLRDQHHSEPPSDQTGEVAAPAAGDPVSASAADELVADPAPGDGADPVDAVDGPEVVERGVAGDPMLPPRAESGPALAVPVTSDEIAALQRSRPEPSSTDPPPAGPPLEPTLDPTPTDVGSAAKPLVGTRWFRIRKRIIAVLAMLVVLGVGYYLVSLFQVWSTGRADADGPVDAIVVMGAAQYDGRPSPQLAERLDHVVVRWEDGVAPLVVATGGNLPGDRFTEAEASATYLIERGVPEEAIVLENSGSTTYESLEGVSELLAARGLDEVVIVTDPYHALRSRLIAEEVGLEASVSSTDTSVVTGGDSLRRHLQEAGGVAVGRIIGFDRLTRIVD